MNSIIKERHTNLCMTHYLEAIEKDREERWIAAGRPTMEQSFAKVKQKMRAFMERSRMQSEREPGED